MRHLTGPTDLPGEQSLRPIGEEASARTVAVPVGDRTELLATAATQVDSTAVLPPYRAGAAGPDGRGGPATAAPRTHPGERSRPWYRRPVVSLSAVGLAGFTIALGVVTVSEGALGRPLSGGSSGTSISKFVNSGSQSSDVTPTPSATPSGSATASPTATTAPPSASATTTAPVVPTTAAPTTAADSAAAPTTAPVGTDAAATPAATN